VPISTALACVGEEKLQDSTLATLAIDLGSTTTVVAIQRQGDPHPQLLDLPPISLRPGEVPSLVWTGEAEPLIGRQVLEAGLADRTGPELARDFKRSIGAGPVPGAAERAGEQLLLQIWARLPKHLTIQRLVLTAPVETYQPYRSWLQQACAALPVQEIALVDEPTAAALGAGLPAGSRLLVVDLGGSTLDLALVSLEGGEGRAAPIAQLLRLHGRSLGDRSRQKLRTARVLGKAGLRLGGRDIDRWIVAACCPSDEPTTTLLNAAERLKCRLSDPDLGPDQELQELAGDQSLRLSRRQLDRLLEERGMDDALERLLEETLAGGRRNSCDLEDLQGVVAVGGGAQLPWLRGWLQEHTAPAPLLTPPPVEAVALGALQLTPGVQVQDVLQHGVSLRTWDQRSGTHRWHPLFVAGQPWPSSEPLELVMAASRSGQEQLELVLAEPQTEGRHDVVFVDGIPTLRTSEAGEVRHQPWPGHPAVLPLDPPGETGQDCLRLRLRIDSDAGLIAEIHDLRSDRELPAVQLGTVR